MTDWFKPLDTILRSPGHVVAAILGFSFAAIIATENYRGDWPNDWIALHALRFIFLLTALLTGAIVISQVVRWSALRLKRPCEAWLKQRQLTSVLQKLSAQSRAALKIVADTGFTHFTGDPDSVYVSELREANLVRVHVAGQAWGQYNLTEAGLYIAISKFSAFATLLNVSPDVVSGVRRSMEGAESFSRRGFK